jgi:hypothetical protein
MLGWFQRRKEWELSEFMSKFVSYNARLIAVSDEPLGHPEMDYAGRCHRGRRNVCTFDHQSHSIQLADLGI